MCSFKVHGTFDMVFFRNIKTWNHYKNLPVSRMEMLLVYVIGQSKNSSLVYGLSLEAQLQLHVLIIKLKKHPICDNMNV